MQFLPMLGIFEIYNLVDSMKLLPFKLVYQWEHTAVCKLIGIYLHKLCQNFSEINLGLYRVMALVPLKSVF